MSLVRVHDFSVSLDGFGTGGGLSLDAPPPGLVDHMHIVVVPSLAGRGVRFSDGLEGLDDGYDVEAASTPSAVTHLTFSRTPA